MTPETRDPVIPPDITTAVTPTEAMALVGLARDKVVLELGAFHGFSTIVLASVAKHVHSVDWHMGDDHAGRGDSWQLFNDNIFRYGVRDRITVYRERFEDELPRMAGRGLLVDGAFLDGMHDEPSVSRDLDLILKLVKPGGFISFHDYGRGPETGNPGFEVTKVADRFGISERVGFLGWGFVPEV